MECYDGLEFLAASRTRVRILELLAERNCVERDALRGHLDASRTTVQRNLDALVDRGWASAGHTEYAITPAGRLAAEAVGLVDERLRAADRLAPLVEHVPSDAFDFDLTALADATVVTAEPGNPYRMVEAHVARIRRSANVRAVLPVTGLHPFETAHGRVVDGEMAAEAVVTPTVARTVRGNDEFADLLADLRETSRFDLFVTDDDVPFYLGLLDDVVQVGVDEDGEPRALLESTNDEVRAWAERTYEQFRDGAEPFEVA